MTLNMEKRSMPVCFTTEQYKKIEEIAKKKGMLNSSQGLEKLLLLKSRRFNLSGRTCRIYGFKAQAVIF